LLKEGDNMQRTRLLIYVMTFLLVTSVFTFIPVFSLQPPIDTSTYYVGTIGQPRNVDPVLAYDTASGELIFNVLEPLIFFNDHKFLPTETSKVNTSDYDNLNSFAPMLATGLPTVVKNTYANDSDRPGSNWTFTINTDIYYQDWTDENGTLHHHQNVTVDDVLYHFQWMLVEDSPRNPQWMFNLPLTGYDYWDSFDANVTTNTIDPIVVDGAGERAVRDLIQNGMKTSGNSITFYFAYDWPQTGLYQMFAQTWGCIEPKDFCISHGCWDGSWADGWSKFRRYPSTSATPLDRHTPYSHYSSSGAEPALCGTGPYSLSYWNQANEQWRIDKFPDYHGGWAGNHVNTVIETGVDPWPTRKVLFLQGEFDTAVVPRANMFDLLDTTAADPVHTPIAGIMLYYGILGLQNDVCLFDFNMSASGKYVPKVNGLAKPDMFNDVHVRRAFASAVNFTTYISGAYYGEAYHPASWWVIGLPYQNVSVIPWDYNVATVTSELAAAGVTSFDITVCYNLGNDGRRLYLEAMRDGFAAINPQFKVTVLGEDGPIFLDDEQSDQLPLWNVGWLADFADDDNFARTYMSSTGAFGCFQHVNLDPISSTVDTMIDQGAALLDPNRDAIYEELQTIYHDHVWGVPTVQAVGCTWHRTWVRNVEINQLYPGVYYYLRYKNAGGALQPVDIDVTHTITQVVGWPTVYIYKGQMRVGYQGVSAGGNASAAIYVYRITVSRIDNNLLVPSLAVVVAIQRNALTQSSAESFAYPTSTTVLLGPSSSATITLLWYEDGVLSALPGRVLVTGVTWQIGLEASVAQADAQDTNLANNYESDGTVTAYEQFYRNLDLNGDGRVDAYDYILFSQLYEKLFFGDINGDGIVDIFDAIIMAGLYGTLEGQSRWNPDANVNPVPDPLTGRQTVDIYDCIILSKMFNRHLQP
jgi:peptide/nickel transport system substrate-binding protein